MAARPEEVLVVRRSVFDELGSFQGISFEVERYLPKLLGPGVAEFMVRSEAEANPGYKQLIPYVVMGCGDRYLCYIRGKREGESRLVGKASIGIGGHINPADEMPLFGQGFREAYLAAVAREVAEEVSVDTTYSEKIAALLNDDSNDVGSVHLGIVHYWRLAAPEVTRREQLITRLAFMDVSEISALKDTLESWSRLCLENLSEIVRRGEDR